MTTIIYIFWIALNLVLLAVLNIWVLPFAVSDARNGRPGLAVMGFVLYSTGTAFAVLDTIAHILLLAGVLS